MHTDSYISRDKIKQEIEDRKKEIIRHQKKIEALTTKHRKPALASIVKSTLEYGITFEEIEAALEKERSKSSDLKSKQRLNSGAPKRSVEPKFRNNETGETWSGRGKAPRWLSEAEAAGKNRNEFLI